MDGLSPPAAGDQSRANSVRVTALTSLTLVVLSSCLRIITRSFIVHQIGWDDFTIILALIAFIVSVAFSIESLRYGNGHHAYYLQPNEIIEVAKWDTLVELLTILITCLTKVSICFFVLRIPSNKRMIRSMYVLIVSLLVVNGATAIVLLAQCRPLNALWNPQTKGNCWSIKVFLYFGYLQGAFAIFTDLICTILPIFVLWKVQMSTKKKVAICALMALGLVSTACCCVRVALFVAIANPLDNSWTFIDVTIWAILEQCTGQIAANLPVLLSLYRFLKKTLPSLSAKLRSYLTTRRAHSSHERSYSKRSGFSQVPDAGDTPLEALSVQKTVDVDVNFNRREDEDRFLNPLSWDVKAT